MKVKKTFEELVAFLESNSGKKVSSILPDILEMCESKKQSNTSIKDADGNVVAIFCWYHKQWELLSEVPYGPKKTSTTGLNTMCKVGVSKWTKKQSTAKKETAEMLDKVQSFEIEASDISKYRDDIEARRLQIDETDIPNGYRSEEEVRKALKA